MSSTAVFLSYASQDAAAALRICEALRAAGIEVWFDQSELRGGDAWDAKIRRQIRECALFVPIISGTTEGRLEGYFRREWRLAVDRTHDMADGIPFLVPVVIDGTKDHEAHVPEAFRAVQWTRLPGGETPPAFAKRIEQLLSGEPEPSPAAREPSRESRKSAKAAAPKQRVPPWKSKFVWVVGALALVAMWDSGLKKFKSPSSPDPTSISTPASGTQAASSTPADLSASAASGTPASAGSGASASAVSAAGKSIAVLPFADMSEKHDQEFFSDGLAEELLDILAKVPQLQVIARTSSFSFKGKADDIPTIGRKLSVAHILEGSVRKSGEHLRITAQLVRAADGVQVWSETYKRNVEDIFKVQDEIARAVAEQLKVQLLGNKPASAAKSTNTDAHLLYLQAQYFRGLQNPGSLNTAIDFYRSALALDSKFAQAWSGLSAAYVRKLTSGQIDPNEGARLSREAANNAIALDPTLGEAYGVLASIAMIVDHDWPAAKAFLAQGRAHDLNDSTRLMTEGVLALGLGRLDEALLALQTSIQHDPLNLLNRRYYARALLYAKRLPEAESEIRQVLEMNPSFPAAHYDLGRILLAKGDIPAAVKEFEAEVDPDWRMDGLPLAYHAAGRTSEAQTALAAIVAASAGQEFQVAEAYGAMGNVDKAFEWLATADKNRDAGVIWLRNDPQLESITKDPRYPALLRKLKLAN